MERDILGIWIRNTEVKFWMKVFAYKTRSVEDMLIAMTQQSQRHTRALQRSISSNNAANMHRPPSATASITRRGTSAVNWPRRLKPIYQAINAEAAEEAWMHLENGPG
ncbi:transposase [Pseudomonas baetica]|uniref:transposase n=1 Tax=Pseudomonas baetica TaxID=674054 RepID=UPI003B8A7B88